MRDGASASYGAGAAADVEFRGLADQAGTADPRGRQFSLGLARQF